MSRPADDDAEGESTLNLRPSSFLPHQATLQFQSVIVCFLVFLLVPGRSSSASTSFEPGACPWNTCVEPSLHPFGRVQSQTLVKQASSSKIYMNITFTLTRA
ncbi:hypothetical protein HBI56_122990 [Parastagonospora nodorum]|uniref:Uncharacterized protein n=1 Tax=Phaeosphaeria nodorum (strain SN15 / ATCC MYA-4574 / FGSC 10173) TaxID=321614 RepID=A0A7U2F482_PHANO|nr:hypothetical protein HBH56_092670 [Parastagonospora nodorum]QRC98393.1 hypothetical protein JI435_435660 [Parastagonospora nodorum SN15]KAH3936172.1 hypothetical protein HBH54_027320 [Parastagonospora nodorum]KAH3948428.1 hypothetical protein HBH53_102140 [Parastagonospora nodorum]KAH3956452.1 hypothetical protein HBH51_241430 [Parastagonospora nodorum]